MPNYNFSPNLIDFSPLGRLGETYDRSVKQRRESEIAANREQALAGFGQNGDLAALGTQLLRAGDLEGGMAALRLKAANEGTPYQRERAAAEDARYEQQRADQQAERDRQEAARQRDDARQDRLQPYTGTDEFKDPRHGLRDPVTGDIFWPDGTVTPGPRRGAPGPQSGGVGDPNLPAPESQTAQAMVGQPAPGANAGYVIPGSLERYPMGTVLPPKGDVAVAAPPPAALPVAPPSEAGRAAVAAPPQAQSPVAAAAEAPAAGAPITATQINRGTANIAPMTNAEMIAEAHRIGISPGQYRAARAAAIQKEMTDKAAGGGALTKEQSDSRAAAGKMIGAEKEYRPNEGETISVWERTKSAIAPGRSENFITSEKYQAGVAAKKEWIAGLLRKESGAAVTPDEFEYYNAIYFPEVGQGGNVAAQKARARERALEGVKAGLPVSQIVDLDRAKPAPAPGQAGDLTSGGSLTTKSGIKATW